MYHSPAPIEGAQVCPAPAALERRGDPAVSAGKRALDLVAAVGALLFFAPLLLLVAVLIRLDSKGPALFRQKRGGLNGHSFVIYKFRTMRVQEDGDRIRHCTRDDARVTRIGAFLRRTSLDELPQLLNVVKGDMSLVGPRPHALAHDELYGALLPEYAERTAAKPGLTGLAQISGLRGDIAELDAMRRRVHCDVEYIRTWSLMGDVRIILTTAVRVLFDRAAY
jgi:putative colanic acid biosynthesis UDP-glucose lipid carrier transferase